MTELRDTANAFQVIWHTNSVRPLRHDRGLMSESNAYRKMTPGRFCALVVFALADLGIDRWVSMQHFALHPETALQYQLQGLSPSLTAQAIAGELTT